MLTFQRWFNVKKVNFWKLTLLTLNQRWKVNFSTLEVTQNSQDSTLAPVPEDWTLINKYNMTLIEVEKRKERALKEEKRRRVKEELESQIQIKEEQKIVAGGSDKQYIEYLKKEQQRWK